MGVLSLLKLDKSDNTQTLLATLWKWYWSYILCRGTWIFSWTRLDAGEICL